MTTPAPIHRELAHPAAMSEFIGGHNDTCGPDAEASALHALDAGYTLDAAQMEAIRKRDIAAGWFNSPANGPGIIINHVRDDLLQFEHVREVAYVPLDTSGASVERVHELLREWAGIHAIILQVLDARQLTGSQQSAAPINHFVAVDGLDSTLGYQVANGDDIRALGAAGQAFYPTRWVGWPSIRAATPIGVFVFDRDANFERGADGWYTDLRTSQRFGPGVMDYARSSGIIAAGLTCLMGEHAPAGSIGITATGFGDRTGQKTVDRLVVWDQKSNAPTEGWSVHPLMSVEGVVKVAGESLQAARDALTKLQEAGAAQAARIAELEAQIAALSGGDPLAEVDRKLGADVRALVARDVPGTPAA